MKDWTENAPTEPGFYVAAVRYGPSDTFPVLTDLEQKDIDAQRLYPYMNRSNYYLFCEVAYWLGPLPDAPKPKEDGK